MSCSDCGDCDSDRGCFLSRGMSLIFHRANMLRLVFVICAGIQLSTLTTIWSDGIVNSLLAYFLSYTPLNNWCSILSTGVAPNCRDYQTGAINEQCRQRSLFLSNYGAGGNALTCAEWESNGAIVLHYGKFIGALLGWVWMFCVFQLIIRCWCKAQSRNRSRSRSPDSRFDSAPCDGGNSGRPRYRDAARDAPYIHVKESKIRGGGIDNRTGTSSRAVTDNLNLNGSQKKKSGKKSKLSDRVPNIPSPPTMWHPSTQHPHLVHSHNPHPSINPNTQIVHPILSDTSPPDDGTKNNASNATPSTSEG